MVPFLALIPLAGVPWSQMTVGVAACAALVYVAKAIVKNMRESMHEVVSVVREISHDNQVWIGNHMSGVTSVLTELVTAAAVLNERVDRLHDDNTEQSARLHRDNLNTAKLLRSEAYERAIDQREKANAESDD